VNAYDRDRAVTRRQSGEVLDHRLHANRIDVEARVAPLAKEVLLGSERGLRPIF